LWIPLRTYQYILRHSQADDQTPSPLGDLALILLLVLAHYPAHHADLVNGVKEGLHHLRDVAAADDDDAEGGGGVAAAAMKQTQHPGFSFARLHDFFATGRQQTSACGAYKQELLLANRRLFILINVMQWRDNHQPFVSAERKEQHHIQPSCMWW
jgi:hypothetical protein